MTRRISQMIRAYEAETVPAPAKTIAEETGQQVRCGLCDELIHHVDYDRGQPRMLDKELVCFECWWDARERDEI